MASSSGTKRKRSYPGGMNSSAPLLSGVSTDDKDHDFVCPICFNLLKEPFMTRCGHTFCYDCIMMAFESSARCPKCNFDLDGRRNDIFPNVLLNELVAKHKTKLDNMQRHKIKNPDSDENKDLLSKIFDPDSNMSLQECEYMMRALNDKKEELLNQSLLVEYKLLQEFLTQLKRIKDDELIRLKRETSVIQDDMNQVESLLNNIKQLKIEDGNPSGTDEEKHQKVPNLSTEGNFTHFHLRFHMNQSHQTLLIQNPRSRTLIIVDLLQWLLDLLESHFLFEVFAFVVVVIFPLVFEPVTSALISKHSGSFSERIL